MRWASFLAAVCIVAGVAAGAAAATRLPLRERLLRTSELGGLVVPGHPRRVNVDPGHPQLVTGVDQWSTSSGGGTPNPYLAEFVGGLLEHYGPNAGNGIQAGSSVAEFQTAAGARYQLASEVGSSHPPAPTFVAFPVAGIPGAHGFTMTGPGFVTYNVMFSDGRFQYEITFAGSPWAIHRQGPVIKAQTITAAQSLYRRVHGR